MESGTALAHGQYGMVGTSKPMREIYTQLSQIAACDASVLIRGETGVGKELVARALHSHHPLRSRHPYGAINCAGIPETLVESELFGYARGAFTGAVGNSPGMIIGADNGTVFLDEIGDMPLISQAKLLRVIEEREVRQLGARKDVKINVRFIAGTNANLERAVDEGKFRSDLYFRLNVFPLNIPPLRERTEDIPLLANHFLALFAKKYAKEPMSIAYAAQTYLKQMPWRGNVRELRNIIENATICSSGGELSEKDISESITRSKYLPLGTLPDDAVKAFYNGTREDMAKLQLEYRLKSQNAKQAAKTLDLSHRTIARDMQKYNIE